MVSHNSFRVMGYVYAGLSLISSLLLLINSSHMVKVTSTRYYDGNHQCSTNWIGGSASTECYGRNLDPDVSGVSIVVLIVSFISIIFNLILIFGMIMRREIFVKYHLRFITTVYVLLALGIFIACIVWGIVIGSSNPISHEEELSAAVTGVTLIHIFGIAAITLYFVLIAWILNGVIEFIKYDNVKSFSLDAAELI